MKKLLALTATCFTLWNCNCGFMPVVEGEDAGSGGGGGDVTGGGGGGGGGGDMTGGGTAAGGGAGGGDMDAGDVDAGDPDAGDVDAGQPDAGDVDAGAPDAGLSCTGRDNAACVLNDTETGLCSMDMCAACTGPSDDARCQAAYGGGSTSWLCEGGQCVLGECRNDGDCASVGKAGQICGLAAPNQCGRCTSDTQCQSSSYGATSICNVAVGLCVPGACSTPNTACSANPSDFCCGGQCVAGNCCTNAQCSGAGSICLNNSCTTCTAVTDGVFYVDPENGSNTLGNGSPSCPFQSLSRGVQYINGVFGSAIPAGTRLLLRGTASASTGETFPIQVPANVVVESEDAGAPQRVIVGGSGTGFGLSAPDSGIRFLVIDGADAGSTGIRVGSGATATTSISDVTVQNLRQVGIRVEGGTVSIGQGVVATGNGVVTNGVACSAGLCVSGGVAQLSVTAGQRPSHFDQNPGNGIAIVGQGRINLTGAPDVTGFPGTQTPPAVANGTGTITASQNGLANVAITSGGNTPSVIDGLVANRGAGNGFNIGAGASVVVRNSVTVGNGQSGVQISPSGLGNFANVNLGSGSAIGNNILQSTAQPNTRAGICIGNFANFALTLSARGNHFGGGRSCATATMPVTTLVTGTMGCMNGLDVGLEPGFLGPQTNIRVDLDQCTDL